MPTVRREARGAENIEPAGNGFLWRLPRPRAAVAATHGLGFEYPQNKREGMIRPMSMALFVIAAGLPQLTLARSEFGVALDAHFQSVISRAIRGSEAAARGGRLVAMLPWPAEAHI